MEQIELYHSWALGVAKIQNSICIPPVYYIPSLARNVPPCVHGLLEFSFIVVVRLTQPSEVRTMAAVNVLPSSVHSDGLLHEENYCPIHIGC